MIIKTKEPANDSGMNNWIAENQKAIDARFGNKAGALPLKVTAVYIVNGDGTGNRL